MFLFKQKTAYDISESEWSAVVCSSDLLIFKRGWSWLPICQLVLQIFLTWSHSYILVPVQAVACSNESKLLHNSLGFWNLTVLPPSFVNPGFVHCLRFTYIQKEVAERIASVPGKKAYGIISDISKTLILDQEAADDLNESFQTAWLIFNFKSSTGFVIVCEYSAR